MTNESGIRPVATIMFLHVINALGHEIFNKGGIIIIRGEIFSTNPVSRNVNFLAKDIYIILQS